MPTQANVPASKWHYTVLWHRSTVHPAARAGLHFVRMESVCKASQTLVGVKTEPSLLSCLSALQPAMDGLHFSLRWDCRQSPPNTTLLLVSTSPSLSATEAELQPRHYRIRLRQKTVEEQCGALAFRCNSVGFVICFHSRSLCASTGSGISLEFIDCVRVQRQLWSLWYQRGEGEALSLNSSVTVTSLLCVMFYDEVVLR